MKTLKWKGFTIKYWEEEFNSEEEVIELVEEIYDGYADEFENAKTINLTNADYIGIGRHNYTYIGGRLDYYCKGYFN